MLHHLPPYSGLQEDPLTALLDSLTAAMQLPEGSLSIESLREVAAPTAELATSASPATRRLLLEAAASVEDAEGQHLLSQRLLLAADGGPVYLTTTLTLDPESVGEGDGSQFSAAWIDAVLAQVASQTASHPVKLAAGSSVQR